MKCALSLSEIEIEITIITTFKKQIIMEQKVFKTIDANCNYVFVKSEQKLTPFRAVKSVYHLDTGETENYIKIEGSDKEQVFDGTMNFYRNEDDFKKGIPVSTPTWNKSLKDIMYDLFRYVKEDENGPYVWTCENGEAVKWRIEEHTNTIVIDHQDKKNTTIGCESPEDYFSPEEVYRYNDYKVMTDDGVIEREGIYKRLFLTDEQNKLVDKLQAVVEECAKNGIAIDFDHANYEVLAFNVNNIKEYGYEPVYDEDKEAAYPLYLTRAGRAIHGISDINTDDGGVYFIIDRK